LFGICKKTKDKPIKYVSKKQPKVDKSPEVKQPKKSVKQAKKPTKQPKQSKESKILTLSIS
jgi:hypothetical protein